MYWVLRCFRFTTLQVLVQVVVHCKMVYDSSSSFEMVGGNVEFLVHTLLLGSHAYVHGWYSHT